MELMKRYRINNLYFFLTKNVDFILRREIRIRYNSSQEDRNFIKISVARAMTAEKGFIQVTSDNTQVFLQKKRLITIYVISSLFQVSNTFRLTLLTINRK